MTTCVGPTDRLDADLRNTIERMVLELPPMEGLRGVSYLPERATGKAITLWATEHDMLASEAASDPIRREFA